MNDFRYRTGQEEDEEEDEGIGEIQEWLDEAAEDLLEIARSFGEMVEDTSSANDLDNMSDGYIEVCERLKAMSEAIMEVTGANSYGPPPTGKLPKTKKKPRR